MIENKFYSRQLKSIKTKSDKLKNHIASINDLKKIENIEDFLVTEEFNLNGKKQK